MYNIYYNILRNVFQIFYRILDDRAATCTVRRRINLLPTRRALTCGQTWVGLLVQSAGRVDDAGWDKSVCGDRSRVRCVIDAYNTRVSGADIGALKHLSPSI